MNPLRDHLISMFEFARSSMNSVLSDFPEDQATFQATDADNHMLWTLGHLAVSDEWILKFLGGEGSPLPEVYGELFGYQSKVQASPEAYPPLAEVKKHFDESRTRLMAWLKAATDERLNQPLAHEEAKDFASTPLVALGKEAWHEGWHAGQLATVRRALGLKPAFG